MLSWTHAVVNSSTCSELQWVRYVAKINGRWKLCYMFTWPVILFKMIRLQNQNCSRVYLRTVWRNLELLFLLLLLLVCVPVCCMYACVGASWMRMCMCVLVCVCICWCVGVLPCAMITRALSTVGCRNCKKKVNIQLNSIPNFLKFLRILENSTHYDVPIGPEDLS